MGKPQKILSSGTARCKLDHYNHDVDVDSTYKFESREVFNGNKFIRVYYHEKRWGVPDYHNYPVCEFNKYFECIEGKI